MHPSITFKEAKDKADLKLVNTHMFFHDDYQKWDRDRRQGRSGKPIYIQPGDQNTVSLFFDDNAENAPPTGTTIVCPLNADTHELISVKDVFERNVFKISTYTAATDENIFISLVETALGNIKTTRL